MKTPTDQKDILLRVPYELWAWFTKIAHRNKLEGKKPDSMNGVIVKQLEKYMKREKR